MKASNFDELLPINGMKLGTAFAGILDVDHRPDIVAVSYTHLTLPTTPYV